jgi:hypothetical protein
MPTSRSRLSRQQRTLRRLQEALDTAQEVYPTTLGHTQRHLISFSVRVMNEMSEYVSIRVTPGAWALYMTTLHHCIFVDIAVAEGGMGCEKSGGLAVPLPPVSIAQGSGSVRCGRFDAQFRNGNGGKRPKEKKRWWNFGGE